MSIENPSFESEREPISFDEVTYMHIDDEPTQHEKLQEVMDGKAGERLGAVQSAEAAAKKIKELVDQDMPPKLVVLDQKLFLYEGDDVPDEEASEQFVRDFEEFRNRPETAGALDDTSIIMLSATADEDYIRSMQEISPAVLGLVEKGQDNTDEQIKSILIEKRIVQDS